MISGKNNSDTVWYIFCTRSSSAWCRVEHTFGPTVAPPTAAYEPTWASSCQMWDPCYELMTSTAAGTRERCSCSTTVLNTKSGTTEHRHDSCSLSTSGTQSWPSRSAQDCLLFSTTYYRFGLILMASTPVVYRHDKAAALSCSMRDWRSFLGPYERIEII